MKFKDIDWVYDHLICKFETYCETCMTGLCKDKEGYWVCYHISDDFLIPAYMIYKLIQVEWTDEFSDFLTDYKKIYNRRFKQNGTFPNPTECPIEADKLTWLQLKWGTNPIIKSIEDKL